MSFLKELEVKFEKCYAEATACKDSAQLVALVYNMIELLEEAEEAYSAAVMPLHMGVHPSNRSGKKMVAVTMHKKGLQYFTSGIHLEAVWKR